MDQKCILGNHPSCIIFWKKRTKWLCCFHFWDD